MCNADGVVTIHHDWEKADAAHLGPLSAPRMAWFIGEARAPGVNPMPVSKRAFDLILVLILLVPLSAVLIGVVQLLAAWRLRQVMPGEWLLAVLGLLSLALGLTLAFSPGAGAVAMLWLIALYALVAGVLMVLLAFKLRRINRRLHTL